LISVLLSHQHEHVVVVLVVLIISLILMPIDNSTIEVNTKLLKSKSLMINSNGKIK